MELLAFILVDGLIYGAWLFIVSVGLTLVFGVLNILNLAHGSLYAIGAYTTASAVGVYFALGGDAFPMGSYIAMILGALLVALVLGPLLERGLLRHFYDRDHVIVVLVTYGVFLILEDVMKLIWGRRSSSPSPIRSSAMSNWVPSSMSLTISWSLRLLLSLVSSSGSC